MRIDLMAEGKAKKILIVDDDRLARLLIHEALAGGGYELVEAEDGPSALQVIAKERPDLLVLDVMMPGTSGWEIVQALRSNPKTRSIPVIICTAKDRVRDMEKSLALGASDYIAKPFDLHELRNKVRKLLIDENLTGA